MDVVSKETTGNNEVKLPDCDYGFDICITYLLENKGQSLSREIVEALVPMSDFMIGPNQVACKTWKQTVQVLNYFHVRLPRELTEDEAIRIHFLGRHHKCITHNIFLDDCKLCRKLYYGQPSYPFGSLYTDEPVYKEFVQWGKDRETYPTKYNTSAFLINVYYHRFYVPLGQRQKGYLENWPIYTPKTNKNESKIISTAEELMEMYKQLNPDEQNKFLDQVRPRNLSVAYIQGDTMYGSRVIIIEATTIEKILPVLCDKLIEDTIYIDVLEAECEEKDRPLIMERLTKDISTFNNDMSKKPEMYIYISVTHSDEQHKHFKYITGGRDGLKIEFIHLK